MLAASSLLSLNCVWICTCLQAVLWICLPFLCLSYFSWVSMSAYCLSCACFCVSDVCLLCDCLCVCGWCLSICVSVAKEDFCLCAGPQQRVSLSVYWTAQKCLPMSILIFLGYHSKMPIWNCTMWHYFSQFNSLENLSSRGQQNPAWLTPECWQVDKEGMGVQGQPGLDCEF